MRRIRVVVAQMPRMLRDIVTGSIQALEDMDVVDCSETPMDPGETAARTAADLVILGCEEEDLPAVGARILHLNPEIKVLAVEADGRRAFLYQLKPHKVTLGEVSPQTLVKAIRQAFEAPDSTQRPDSGGEKQSGAESRVRAPGSPANSSEALS